MRTGTVSKACELVQHYTNTLADRLRRQINELGANDVRITMRSRDLASDCAHLVQRRLPGTVIFFFARYT